MKETCTLRGIKIPSGMLQLNLYGGPLSSPNSSGGGGPLSSIRSSGEGGPLSSARSGGGPI